MDTNDQIITSVIDAHVQGATAKTATTTMGQPGIGVTAGKGRGGASAEIGSDLGLSHLERVTGIEPALSAWEADVLPLNYTRAHERGLVTLTAGRACAVFAQTSYRNR